MSKHKRKTSPYLVLYAEDVPCYGTAEIRAAGDAEALAAAKAIDSTDLYLEPEWNNAFCRRIIHIEADDGRVIAENISLDNCRVVWPQPPAEPAPSSLADIPVYSVENTDGELIGFTLTEDPGAEANRHSEIDPCHPDAPLLLAGFATHAEAIAFASGLACALGDECGYTIHTLYRDLTCVLVEFFNSALEGLRYADMRPGLAKNPESSLSREAAQ